MTAPILWHGARYPMSEDEICWNTVERDGGSQPQMNSGDSAVILERDLPHMRAPGQFWERVAS